MRPSSRALIALCCVSSTTGLFAVAPPPNAGVRPRPAAADEPAVPAWFRPDPKDPYAVFDAWRHLSTTDAVLICSSMWDVCAGCLRDENGKPMANCPLAAIAFHEVGSYCPGIPERLVTDKDGYFIIYGPDDGLKFSAAPGCPFSPIAWQYASANRGVVACNSRVIQLSKERRFDALTCLRKSTYNEKELDKFVQREMADWSKRPAFRTGPR